MTQVTYGGDGSWHYLRAAGHATGSPEVCAAVSGLVYALAGCLKSLERQGRAEVRLCSLESGDAVLDAEGGAELDGAFDTAVIGLLQIAQKYPEFVRVEHLEK